MPAAGRKPKPDGQKRNRVKPVHDWVEVIDVPFEGRRLSFRARKRTAEWWAGVSTMPHCVLWSESDWQFALDTALLHAEFDRGEVKLAAELRMREKVMGTTMDARRDLRIRYVSPTDAGPQAGSAEVTDMAAYRDAVS